MTIIHECFSQSVSSLRAQFFEEKTQNLQLVKGPKSTFEIVDNFVTNK